MPQLLVTLLLYFICFTNKKEPATKKKNTRNDLEPQSYTKKIRQHKFAQLTHSIFLNLAADIEKLTSEEPFVLPGLIPLLKRLLNGLFGIFSL